MSTKDSRERFLTEWRRNDARNSLIRDAIEQARRNNARSKSVANSGNNYASGRAPISVSFRRTDKDNRTGVSVTSRLMGDPPPHRSALEKKS